VGACAGLLGAGCGGVGSSATVAGKTAYGEMAIEGASVAALRRDGEELREVASTRSGYHGSWVLRLPPGTYRLEARASLPRAGQAPLSLTGSLDGVSVGPDLARVDRLLIRLVPRKPMPPR